MWHVKFLVLLNEDDPSAWERASDEQRQAVFDAHAAFDAALAERGAILAGEALAGVDQARGVSGGLVVEGPFAEAAEHLGGFYLVELESMEVALELAQLLPSGYDVEVRPVIAIEGYDG